MLLRIVLLSLVAALPASGARNSGFRLQVQGPGGYGPDGKPLPPVSAKCAKAVIGLPSGTLIRLGALEEISEIRRLLNQFREVFPYIQNPALKEAIEKQELAVVTPVENTDVLLGMIRWHQRRDGWVTVHEIVTHRDHSRRGIARALMNSLPRPRTLKCITSNQGAMKFYKSLGMKKVRTEAAKDGRQLAVWADPSTLPVPPSRQTRK